MKYKYNGQWYDLSCSLNVSNLLIGEIIEYAGESIPGGYLVCDGSAISRTEYSELFDVIGTLYGSGDGSTTFNLPDLRGRVVTGLSTTNSNFNVLGKTGGEETHTLTINEMPSHNHKMYSPASVTVATGSNYGIPDMNISTTPTTNTGGGQAHNNLQPYITINYLIRAKKTKNVLASGSTVIDSLNGDSTVDAPSVRAVNEKLNNKIVKDILFSGVGTKATNLTDYFTTTMTKNPLDYDFVIITFSNNGHQYEQINVVMAPKTDSNGVVAYFAATTLYYVYMRVVCIENAIQHRIMENKTWATSDVYIKSVIGIKIN